MPGGESAVGDIRSKEVSPERGRTPDRGEPPEHGKQSVYCQLTVKKGTCVPGIRNIKDGFIAIVMFDPLEFGCDSIQGLAPGYTLEFSFSPVACPFQGIFETVRGVYTLPVCTTTGTCPELGSFPVIGFNSGDNPIFDMYPQHTSTTTIMWATG
jgi:hypothetical protein